MRLTRTRTRTAAATPKRIGSELLIELLQRHFETSREVRRGICLLNAGEHDQAAEAFSHAASLGCSDRSLPSYLAACHLGRGQPGVAAETLAKEAGDKPAKTDLQIRHALAQWASGQREEAISSLRESIRLNPECAELHFQLGTRLSTLERYEEAELRFTQALNIDSDHTEALVSLALCCGVRGTPDEGLEPLQRAQAQKPHDPRIGLLLAQAAKAVRQKGHAFRMRAAMPEDEVVADRRGTKELARVSEADPDFVDAFLSLPAGLVGERIFGMLLQTLEVALEHQPEHAELHYHCGRVLERLGRNGDAIDRAERAVAIDARFTRALIELGKLYQKTDRTADATARLEQAIAAGAEYADVYYLLGNLYHRDGHATRARTAYQRALLINEDYTAARKALEALPA